MRAVARGVAFGMGLGLGVLALGWLSWLHYGMWAPLALALVLGGLFYSSKWITARGIAGAVALTSGAGVSWGWLVTSGTSASRVDFRFFPAMLTGGLTCVGCVAWIAILLSLPAKQRLPAARLALPVLMAVLVAFFSSPIGAASPMRGWLVDHFGLSAQTAEGWVIVARKTVHFTYYGSLALASWWSAKAAKESLGACVRFGVVFALAVAAFDEIRQSGVSGRTGSAYDVLLDFSGMAIYLLVAVARTRPKAKPVRKPKAPSTAKPTSKSNESRKPPMP